MSETVFGSVNWTIFVVYLLGVFALGAMFARRQTSTDEFFRAGRRMGWFPIMISLIASLHSAVSFMGQPARVYKNDAGVLIAVYISGFFVFPIVAYLMVPFYRKLDVTTAYEYLEKRFASSTRLLASALFIFQRIFWMTLVTLAPSLALSVIVGIRVEYCILMVGLIATLYTALGGMSAVIWTDVAQFIVLTIGEILIFVIVATKLEGGFMEMIRVGFADDKVWGSFNWDITSPTFWTLLISGCVMGLGWGFDQVQVQRLMSAKDEKATKKSILYLLIINVPRFMILILMGLAIYAFYKAFPGMLSEAAAQQPDKILPYFVMTQVPVGISGIIIAAIFAASMSSFDSGLNCIVATVTVDWYKKLKGGQADDKYLFFAKILSLVLGIAITILTIIIYKMGIKSMIDVSNKYAGLLFGPIIGIFLLGVLTRRAKEIPALIGGIVAFVTILIIDIVNITRSEGNPILSVYLYGPLSVLVTILIGYLGSFFGTELLYEKIREYTLAKKR